MLKKKENFRNVVVGLQSFERCVFIKGLSGELLHKLQGEDLVFFGKDLFFLSRNSYINFKSLVERSVEGLTHGYYCELTFVGLGYRFLLLDNVLLLKIGYSHYIKLPIPSNLHVFGYKKRLVIFGISLFGLNFFVNKLRSFKKIDVYKGKGINLLGEVLRVKVGKQKV